MTERVLPIQLRGLTFRPAGTPVLSDLSACIAMPGITALVGPNGAGKSVCLRLVNGLLPLEAGSITFGPLGCARVRQAFVFQRTALIRASVKDNVALALKAAGHPRPTVRRLVGEALETVGLADRADEAATHLSGGEVQRLALARAMVADPDLLLLDEPTASLDPNATEAVERLIRDMAAKGTKVLLVSHNLGQVARLAADVLVIAKGRVVEHGSVRQVLSAPRHSDTITYLKGELPWPSSALAS